MCILAIAVRHLETSKMDAMKQQRDRAFWLKNNIQKHASIFLSAQEVDTWVAHLECDVGSQ